MSANEKEYIEVIHTQIEDLNEIFSSVAEMVCQQAQVSLDIFGASFSEQVWDDEMDIDQKLVGIALMCFYFFPQQAAGKPEADLEFFEKVFSSAVDVMKRANFFAFEFFEIIIAFDAVCVD